MSDITMCGGIKNDRNCPQRENCYRFTARPSEWRQSFFAVAPFEASVSSDTNEQKTSCDYFWDNQGK